MSFDSDVAVFGTGIAPLIGANYLLAQGKSVLLLNPDRDFFLEDSELPFDPFLPKIPEPERLKRSLPEETLAALRPDFPGAIELWYPGIQTFGYHDHGAPHVRQRNRLWLSQERLREDLERLYVEASDAGLNPTLLEGISAIRRFPGFTASGTKMSGLLIPKMCDVDVVRYRNGLLEYLGERLGSQYLIPNATQIDIMPGGIRFHCRGSPCTAKLKYGALAFWTPRLSPWILQQAKARGMTPRLPEGLRLWEQWSLDLNRPIDPNTIGIFENMAIWAETEGFPHQTAEWSAWKETDRRKTGISFPKLSVLRAGPLIPLAEISERDVGLNWASAESFSTLDRLAQEFLHSENFAIRSFKPKAIFEWQSKEPWLLNPNESKVRIVPASDGPLVDILQRVRFACNQAIQEV